MKRKHKKLLIRIIVAAAFTLMLIMLGPLGVTPPRPVMLALCIVPYLIAGYDVLRKAAKNLTGGRFLDECFLMTVATTGAFVLGYITDGSFFEAVAVMLFYQTGELFQGMAVDKSRKNIAALMDIRPDHANVIAENGNVECVDPDTVPEGSVILIKPGEKVPIDGRVISGESTLDTAALTGESVPRRVSEGDDVMSGCVNLSGELRLETTKRFAESTVSRILELVENAGNRKSRSEQFISKFARIYTPLVCALAVLLAVLPPLISLLIKADPAWLTWLYRALAFLVASCPCALVVSIPLSFFAGIGGASRDGVLIKGSNYLEALSKADTVVFDKTGTLTEGSFRVTDVIPAGDAEPAENADTIIELAAHAEIDSNHPVGLSLVAAYGREPDRSRVSGIRNIPGKGVTAYVDGKRIAAGNIALMHDLQIDAASCGAEEDTGATCVYVAEDNVCLGLILISDRVKPSARGAVRLLKDYCGVRQTVLLTGDMRKISENVGKYLEFDRTYSELLPEDKVSHVEELLSTVPAGRKLVFTGDGINDAPVLVRSDVGVAMGGIGSDAAIEAADVVLMDDDPVKLAHAIRLSKKCMRIVYENTVFAIGIKILSLLLVALGIGGMWLAIFADVGVMVLAVLNAIRAIRPPKMPLNRSNPIYPLHL